MNTFNTTQIIPKPIINNILSKCNKYFKNEIEFFKSLVRYRQNYNIWNTNNYLHMINFNIGKLISYIVVLVFSI